MSRCPYLARGENGGHDSDFFDLGNAFMESQIDSVFRDSDTKTDRKMKKTNSNLGFVVKKLKRDAKQLKSEAKKQKAKAKKETKVNKKLKSKVKKQKKVNSKLTAHVKAQAKLLRKRSKLIRKLRK